MFKYKVEVRLSFASKKEVDDVSKETKVKRFPVMHRKMYLDGKDEVFGITRWRIVCRIRQVQRVVNGELVVISEYRFSTSYIPPPKKDTYWDTRSQVFTEFVREKEPSGRVTPAYDLEGILRWLQSRVADPVAAVTELLTAQPVKEELEEAA